MEPIESDPHNHLTIRFSDTGSSIGLSGCDELLPFFDSILCGWPHSIHHSKSESEAAFLTIEREGFRYRMTPCQDEKAISFSDPVDLVCAVIVEIAWETLRANPQWLCLHCAAVELDGKLILFPNTRRAGKSTLTAALGLHGSSIFTDDFLAIEADPGRPICGISSGVSVRMRKPWPENVPNSFNELLASSEVTASDRYSYHARHNSMPVKRGRRVPIGGIVLLERGEQASANLDKANRSEILGAMITQNFSRAGNSARILRLLHCLVCEIDSYVLRYSDPVEATVLLQKFFSQTDPEKAALRHQKAGSGSLLFPISKLVLVQIPSLTRMRASSGPTVLPNMNSKAYGSWPIRRVMEFTVWIRFPELSGTCCRNPFPPMKLSTSLKPRSLKPLPSEFAKIS